MPTSCIFGRATARNAHGRAIHTTTTVYEQHSANARARVAYSVSVHEDDDDTDREQLWCGYSHLHLIHMHEVINLSHSPRAEMRLGRGRGRDWKSVRSALFRDNNACSSARRETHVADSGTHAIAITRGVFGAKEAIFWAVRVMYVFAYGGKKQIISRIDYDSPNG